MQENPLVDFSDLQQLTYFLAIKSLNIPKRYDLALAFGKLVERRTDSLRKQPGDHAVLGVFNKVLWWSNPVTGFIESVGVDCSFGPTQGEIAAFPCTS